MPYGVHTFLLRTKYKSMPRTGYNLQKTHFFICITTRTTYVCTYNNFNLHFVSPRHDFILVTRNLKSLPSSFQTNNSHVRELNLICRRKNRHLDSSTRNVKFSACAAQSCAIIIFLLCTVGRGVGWGGKGQQSPPNVNRENDFW